MTTNGDDPRLVEPAQRAAQEWQLPYVERRRKAPLWPLLKTQADAFLVFTHEGVALWDSAGALKFQPGIAHLRVKRLDAGVVEDTLVRLAGFREGESVLDLTLGLAQDALVAARAVGPGGRVLGIEKSFPLYAVISRGLVDYDAGPRSCAIDVQCADGRAFIANCLADSFDVVLIDPMFARPKKSQPSFETLRRYAAHEPWTPADIDHARRVARRCVVVKGGKGSRDLSRLGLTAEPVSRYASVEWAVLRK